MKYTLLTFKERMLNLKSEERLLRVTLHEVPEDDDALDVPVVEGIVVGPVAVALDDLLVHVTAAPPLAVEPVLAVHESGVGDALHVAVHVSDDLPEVDHLDVVVVPVTGDGGVVRAEAKVIWARRGEGDGAIIETVEINDVHWRVGHGVVTPGTGQSIILEMVNLTSLLFGG